MLTKKSQKVDYADVRPSLQITFQYWRCKILRCFLLTNTSFPFFFTNLHCLLGKIFEYGILVPFSFLQFLRIFILSLQNDNWATAALSLSFDFFPTRCEILLVYYTYYLCSSPVFPLTSHRSCFHALPMILCGLL